MAVAAKGKGCGTGSRTGGGTGGGWSEARSIEEVLDRMDTIRAALPPEDGVATFNRMYTQTTVFVRSAIEANTFGGGAFLERLDVHFANLFFWAHHADLVGDAVPTAWAPLFAARAKPRTHPIQFALAGMNAHICHDLPSAVVTTCRELGIDPVDDSPEHIDFSTTNHVLEQAKDDIKGWFTSGIVARIDDAGGRLDDGLAMFAIHTARAAAWQVSQLEWGLADNPRLDAMFRENLARGVAIGSRGILL